MKETGAGPKTPQVLSKVFKWISHHAGDMNRRIRTSTAEGVFIDICGVRLASTTPLSPHMAQIVQVLEPLLRHLDTINRNLSGIQEELRKQNILASSGGSGAQGFANIVYNFVNMHTKTTTHKNDLFFVWHPDTSWHPIFYEMVAKNPLPNSFIGESADLDKLCASMKTIRDATNHEHGGKKPIFHLLIPSWYNIRWTESVRFPDELLPLRVIGPTHDMGRPLVSFRLPFQQPDLRLDDIGNSFDANYMEENGYSPAVLIIGGVAGVMVSMATAPSGGLVGIPAAVGAIIAGIGSSSNGSNPKGARILGSSLRVF